MTSLKMYDKEKTPLSNKEEINYLQGKVDNLMVGVFLSMFASITSLGLVCLK